MILTMMAEWIPTVKDNLRLFDNFERTDLDPSDYSEPQFLYLNRTARPKFSYLRTVIQEWFDDYVASTEKREKIAREFRSTSNSNRVHHNAFFELLIYTLLKKSGFEVQVEPELTNGTKPDFIVLKEDQEILVEVTGCYSEQNFGAGRVRENRILDAINNRVNLPDFFIDLHIISSPSDNVPEKRLASFIQSRFDKLDREQIIYLYENQGELPVFEWKEDNWHVKFSPIPKSDKLRGDASVRNIGIQTYPFIRVKVAEDLKSSINKKYSRYGTLEKPFILAVNIIDNFVNDDNISEALFGDYLVIYDPKTGLSEDSREPNGAWFGPKGFQKSRMSGLLAFNNLLPWTLHIADPKLWYHPNASYPINPDLFPVNQLIPSQSSYEQKDGQTLCELLDLDSDILYQVET